VPADASFTDAAYYKGTVLSTSGAPDVAPLDEASWIDAANTNNGAAPSFVIYSAAPKLDTSNFSSIAVSAAPVPSGVRFTGGVRPEIEAVLPSKKKPRFKEAYLAAL
jgi:hypothetical protein